ncbi:POT family-domain-containing protein [Hyaloraphidium curvatum]|nr:POT family-domain-containing protein [Hyaloraphidium curvatum]
MSTPDATNAVPLEPLNGAPEAVRMPLSSSSTSNTADAVVEAKEAATSAEPATRAGTREDKTDYPVDKSAADGMAEDLFAGMSEKERELKMKEIEWNAKLDAKLREHPDRMPAAVWYIVPNEAGERFTYYGVKPLLKNFLGIYLNMGLAFGGTMVYIFTMFSYFFPLVGAAISDSFLTKFKTILIGSFVYLAGIILMAVSASPTIMSSGMAVTGLMLIALGAGAIKPCVSSHGGDQFLPEQKVLLNQFYNYFYMSINIGSLVAGFVIPAIRQLSCGGVDTCYTWAFGTCAMVFGIALTLFWIGDRVYRVVPPLGTFVPWVVMKISFVSLSRRWGKSKEELSKYRHFCAIADDVAGEEMADETMDTLYLFPPLALCPAFWMAFDQNYVLWANQGMQMQPLGAFNDEMAAAIMASSPGKQNPLLILALVPVFTQFIYPQIEKRTKFPLVYRMAVGMFFAGAAFCVSNGLQYWIESNCLPYDYDGYEICRNPNVSIMWQWIPYFVMTIGEVLFSISGLNFTYEQVGSKMKASAAALWLLTSAIANLLDAVLWDSLEPMITAPGAGKVLSMTQYTWMIAGIAFAAAIGQTIIARYYVYREDRPYHQGDEQIKADTLSRRKEVEENEYFETQKAITLSRTN